MSGSGILQGVAPRRVLKDYGASFLAWRALWDLARRSGFLAWQLPAARRGLARARRAGVDIGAGDGGYAGGPLPGDGPPLSAFLRPAPDLAPWLGAGAPLREAAERLLAGELIFFQHAPRTVGHPPDWFRSAGDGRMWPQAVHWSRIPDLSSDLGDIKWVWEPARFAQAFLLGRAYRLTGAERYAEAFWLQVEDWQRRNPPELGPHWRCGQELALRVLAWVFALQALRGSAASRPEREAALAAMIGYHAYHIERVHWYAARCVRNNHAISEATALYSVGVLFPQHRRSAHWRRLGRRYLEQECAWQIYDDGSYVQHSLNYARSVVQLLSWSLAVARAAGEELPRRVRDRAARLGRFLYALLEPETGRVPNYGPNDGALFLPLSDCAAGDFRPALGALSRLLGEGRLFPPGPWDEEAAWLGAPPEPDAVAPREPASAFPAGGYYCLRGRGTRAMIRCAAYRHRPHQADMLHCDLWYHGSNVLIDAGTFAYQPDSRWARHFAGTAVHNTVGVDGRDQMRRGARFLWHGWIQARRLAHRAAGATAFFRGEHSGYGFAVHRRSVWLRDATYLVVDELRGDGAEHDFRLHWLVGDFQLVRQPWGAGISVPGGAPGELQLVVAAPAGAVADWQRANEAIPRGWQSHYYGERRPAWSFAASYRGAGARFATLIGPQADVAPLMPLSLARADELAAAWERDS